MLQGNVLGLRVVSLAFVDRLRGREEECETMRVL